MVEEGDDLGSEAEEVIDTATAAKVPAAAIKRVCRFVKVA